MKHGNRKFLLSILLGVLVIVMAVLSGCKARTEQIGSGSRKIPDLLSEFLGRSADPCAKGSGLSDCFK